MFVFTHRIQHIIIAFDLHFLKINFEFSNSFLITTKMTVLLSFYFMKRDKMSFKNWIIFTYTFKL
jgi:hypothetical protein